MDFRGPYDSDFVKTDLFDVTNATWSPCGAEGLLNINAQVRLIPDMSADEGALISLTSLDGC